MNFGFRETVISMPRLGISINKNLEFKSKFWTGDILWKA